MAQASRKATEPFVMILAFLWLTVLSLPAHAEQRLLVMGDSLSAAYGLRSDQGWVSLLDRRLERDQPGWRVVNASISGETTAGGASRIASELERHTPAVVLIQLGANDGLRGLPLDAAEANLDRMIREAQKKGARVGLLGIRIPPNYGPDYTGQFDRMYTTLAARYSLPLLPFLLEPIVTDRAAFQSDNLHPTAEAQPALLAHVWPLVADLTEPRSAATAGSSTSK